MPAEDFGSSPHTWGILQVMVMWQSLLRFIPTHVGHTSWLQRYKQTDAVHPHMRRAYRFTAPFWASVPGSSPHAWGILRVRVALHVHPRFIPTYVGHTDEVLKLTETARFIPTYVGHTLSISPSSRISMVHPHTRGAYALGGPQPPPACGSSPHTWGIQGPQQAGCT